MGASAHSAPISLKSLLQSPALLSFFCLKYQDAIEWQSHFRCQFLCTCSTNDLTTRTIHMSEALPKSTIVTDEPDRDQVSKDLEKGLSTREEKSSLLNRSLSDHISVLHFIRLFPIPRRYDLYIFFLFRYSSPQRRITSGSCSGFTQKGKSQESLDSTASQPPGQVRTPGKKFASSLRC